MISFLSVIVKKRFSLESQLAPKNENLILIGFQIFEQVGAATFVVPKGITEVRVAVVGGGGGGANGHSGGGGSGRVTIGTLKVTPEESISLKVGGAGLGAAAQVSSNIIRGSSAGGESSFKSLTAPGGTPPAEVDGWAKDGASGGSGGTAAGPQCNANMRGGTGGLKGADCKTIASEQTGDYAGRGGAGQGDYTGLLSTFKLNTLTAGEGGLRSSTNVWANGDSWSGGGGGGGILINTKGPKGQKGAQTKNGSEGGNGYGGGGGGGGLDDYPSTTRQKGGDGASGVVYVEWG